MLARSYVTKEIRGALISPTVLIGKDAICSVMPKNNAKRSSNMLQLGVQFGLERNFINQTLDLRKLLEMVIANQVTQE